MLIRERSSSYWKIMIYSASGFFMGRKFLELLGQQIQNTGLCMWSWG
ncbi:unnamed protein product [Musa hybrid cultivar]